MGKLYQSFSIIYMRKKINLSMLDLPNYLAIFASVIAGVLGIFSDKFLPPGFGIIVFLLGIMTLGMILEKRNQQNFQKKVISISSGKNNSDDFLLNLSDLDPLEKRLTDVKEIWISGLTLAGFLLRYEKTLYTYLSKGCKIKIMIGPEESDNILSILPYLEDAYAENNYQRYTSSINLSISILKNMSRLNKNIEIKKSKIMPHHNLIILNPYDADGEAQVHLNLYKIDSDVCPVFILRWLTSPERFTLFRTEFDLMWDRATK